MNPTLNDHQSLLISTSSSQSDLSILLDACEEYMLDAKTAKQIIGEVVDAVKGWHELAVRLGISKREMDLFRDVFERNTIRKH